MSDMKMNNDENRRKLTKEEIELSDTVSDASVMLERAMAALRTTISYYNLDKRELTHVEELCLINSIDTVHQLLEIVDDYIFEANNKLQTVIE